MTITVEQHDGANTPATMRDTILAVSAKAGRTLAVLGDMPGLGANELALHAELAEPLTASGIARVFTVGECMRALRGALPQPMRAAHADTADLIEADIRNELRSGDTLLIKGADASFRALAERLTHRGTVHAV